MYLWLNAILGAFFIYIALSLYLTWHLLKNPRKPIDDKPDYGFVQDQKIKTSNNKLIECWVIYPEHFEEYYNEDPSDPRLKKNKTILLIHGTGRNRGRMVKRAKWWYNKGYTIILISARDHGGSDNEPFGVTMPQFVKDIESTIEWWGAPVILYGHSIAAGAVLVAAANKSFIRGVISLNSPAIFPHDLQYVLDFYGGWMKWIFYPSIKAILSVYFRSFDPIYYQPIAAAAKISVPVLLLHGKKDEFYPYHRSLILHNELENSTLQLLEDANHYNIHKQKNYRKILEKFLIDINGC